MTLFAVAVLKGLECKVVAMGFQQDSLIIHFCCTYTLAYLNIHWPSVALFKGQRTWCSVMQYDSTVVTGLHCDKANEDQLVYYSLHVLVNTLHTIAPTYTYTKIWLPYLHIMSGCRGLASNSGCHDVTSQAPYQLNWISWA